MALIPMLLNEMLEDYSYPMNRGHLYDQDFGLGMDDFPIYRARPFPSLPGIHSGYLRPWRLQQPNDSGVSSVKNDEREFSVQLDVAHFKPEELTVKLDDKGFVVVTGKHEEKSDNHGFVSRQFTRRYKLPENTLTETLSSNLSKDGVLSLTAAKKVPIASNEGREIKITQTNKPAVRDAAPKQGTVSKQQGNSASTA